VGDDLTSGGLCKGLWINEVPTDKPKPLRGCPIVAGAKCHREKRRHGTHKRTIQE